MSQSVSIAVLCNTDTCKIIRNTRKKKKIKSKSINWKMRPDQFSVAFSISSLHFFMRFFMSMLLPWLHSTLCFSHEFDSERIDIDRCSYIFAVFAFRECESNEWNGTKRTEWIGTELKLKIKLKVYYFHIIFFLLVLVSISQHR